MTRFFLAFIFSFFIFQTTYGKETVSSMQRMVQDLDFIRNSIDVKYAPKYWKSEFCKWNLLNAYDTAKDELVSRNCKSNLKNYHRVLKKFLQSTKDYHVGIAFYSTEKATLPFTVKGSGKRYFVVDVDREGLKVALERLLAPMLTEGDEIITFGGEAIDTVIGRIIKEELGGACPETDHALAELILTNRSGMRGEVVPKGNVDIKIRKRFTGKEETYTYTWDYTPEKVLDATQIEKRVQLPMLKAVTTFKNEAFQESEFLEKMMISPLFLNLNQSFRGENKFEVGSRTSYVPRLGKKIWETDEGSPFDAYIFTMPSTSSLAQKKIGYIRIPSYVGTEDEANEFCDIISQFQWRTEALVIDQINNPGGSIFYLYALASMLTDHPLNSPKHHIALTQQEVFMAHKLLAALENVTDDVAAKEAIGETLHGYPVDMLFVSLLKQFCEFVIAEWESGNHYTSTIHIFGIDEIIPHPRGHYSKPILLLTNNLDFSGGDFFPAILQDNGRATILGTRTAGAGGYVLFTQFPNRTGIAGVALTGSLAERTNHKPIENLGVTPDIYYECTPEDLTGNFEGYAAAIIKGIESIVKK